MTSDALTARPARPAFLRPGPLARYRWAVASRSVAAVFGGYALSAAFAGALSLALPLMGAPRAEAVLWSTMLAFLVHASAALWAFGCASAWRAWAGIGGLTALAALAAWLLPRLPTGGPA